MENQNKIKNSGRVWSGILIILIGCLFLLSTMGLDIPGWIFSWHTFLIVLGAFVGIRHNFRGIGWLILILIGSYFTLRSIPDLGVDVSKYALGVGFVLLGFFLIVRPKRACDRNTFKRKFESKFGSKGKPDFFQEPEKITNNDVLDVIAVFGGSHQSVYSKDFKGGDITAVFGGADINMTQADFENSVSLDVTAVFGGIKLVVPQNWAIKSNVTALFGSVEDKRSQVIPDGEIQKTLILDGTAMFGGIEIKNF